MADRFDVRRARSATGLLGAFSDAGVLAAADVHVARALAALTGEQDEAVLLAAALAVRAPRLGHVHVDLVTISETVTVDSDEPVDLDALPWPPPNAWVEAVAASPLAASGEDDPAIAPLRLLDGRLHLDRLWQDERSVAGDLVALAATPPEVDDAVLADGLRRLFPGEGGGRQALAAASAVLSRFAVIAGGPGTGKTTTVARVLALLFEQARATGTPEPLVALAAPTGKAAARLQEAVLQEADGLDTELAIRASLGGLEAATLHRTLGWRPGTESRFKHDRGNRLPHDVVVVDESSMVSLSLMARLAEAVRPDARLVLVGDPQQLVAIEAGAVLGDVVGSSPELHLTPARRARLEALAGAPVDSVDPPPGARIADGVVVLDRVHRFGAGIDALSTAIRLGDAARTLEVLRSGVEGVRWLQEDAATSAAVAEHVRERAVAAGGAVVDAARAGHAGEALHALGTFRVLCAHRRGPYGVATWADRIEEWLAAARPGLRIAGSSRPFAGQALLVTENDRELRLFNGDTGVVVDAGGGELRAAFERGTGTVLVSPSRLAAVEPLHAMTVHKAQGSQVDRATVLLPDAASRLLTRELLYTAVTRAKEEVVVVGPEAAVREAVGRPAGRASGLGDRL